MPKPAPEPGPTVRIDQAAATGDSDGAHPPLQPLPTLAIPDTPPATTSTPPPPPPAAAATRPPSPGSLSPISASGSIPGSGGGTGKRSRLSSFFRRTPSGGGGGGGGGVSAGDRNGGPPAALDGSATHYIPEPERGGHRRLSERLRDHNKHRAVSVHIPDELLQVPAAENGASPVEQWDKHASQLLFASSPDPDPEPGARSRSKSGAMATLDERGMTLTSGGGPEPMIVVGDEAGIAEILTAVDHNELTVEKAIELHERNEIARSTQIFQALADPAGPNNSIAQVFYGLAKRHGWGCTMDPRGAFRYLKMGAANAAMLNEHQNQHQHQHVDTENGTDSNSAANSAATRQRRQQQQGAYTRKVLAMAIFELANCYRNAWGTSKDPVAARHYYETAANLGDADAMCEAAWCFEKGFGGKKNKPQAAHYYRLARANGVSMAGMSWIDKPAYTASKD
ncbi:hypothetical protein KEM52_004464 [Ascosphaera acerosa]|nr:hypothetical protein KEM52_004464 [Ascosphaera acerosa]